MRIPSVWRFLLRFEGSEVKDQRGDEVDEGVHVYHQPQWLTDPALAPASAPAAQDSFPEPTLELARGPVVGPPPEMTPLIGNMVMVANRNGRHR